MASVPGDQAEVIALISGARAGDKFSLSQLISLFENKKSKAVALRQFVLASLQAEAKQYRNAYLLGVTGTPGAGKSSLIGKVSEMLLSTHSSLTIAVIAVDPASDISGGALLGDRTRVHIRDHKARFFFRSQSSNRDLGGISFLTFQVLRLLRYFFDLIIIETVGIGQSEISIKSLVDQTVLVLQPLSGDQIQFLKAGIMEIPDTFIVNKCDQEKLAKQSFNYLKSSIRQYAPLKLGRQKQVGIQHQASIGKILLTSALNGIGVEETANHIFGSIRDNQENATFIEKEQAYFKQWVGYEHGQAGLRQLPAFHEVNQQPFSLEAAQQAFLSFYRQGRNLAK